VEEAPIDDLSELFDRLYSERGSLRVALVTCAFYSLRLIIVLLAIITLLILALLAVIFL